VESGAKVTDGANYIVKGDKAATIKVKIKPVYKAVWLLRRNSNHVCGAII
jgi:hypothetical protein